MYGILKLQQLILNTTKDALTKAINNSLLPNVEIPAINVEIPKDPQNGDFSVNTAMQLARSAKMAPRAIADIIVQNMDTQNTDIQKVEIAGAGFINFYLSVAAYQKEVELICAEKNQYGKIPADSNSKRINIEYVSANPTGPLHLGNARGGCIGSVISGVYRACGWEVCEEFYLNDAGNQIVKFGQSLSARFMQLFDESYPFPEDGYQGEDVKELAKQYFEEFGDKLKNEDDETRAQALASYGLEKNTLSMRAALDRYSISYDVWFKESELHSSGAVKNIVVLLSERGATYEKDGAVWFRATDYGCEKDEVLIRNNGIPTYYAADIAYHYDKLVKRNFDVAVNVWGADHHGHVLRLKMALKALGIDPNRLKVILMQLVQLVRGDETVRLSKRKGEIVTLDELLNEVGVDAVRYVFNDYAPATHMNFDLDLALKQSSENPVFYVQYAHARIKSILRNLTAKTKNHSLSLLCEKQEISLMKTLSSYQKVLTECAAELDPSKLTKYSFEVASAFHSFYNACRVNCEDEELMSARLMLVEASGIVLASVLNTLGVSSPEQM